MAVRRHEVQAAVDAVVLDVLAIQSALVREVLAELFVDVWAARPPALLTVYRVTETWVQVIIPLSRNEYQDDPPDYGGSNNLWNGKLLPDYTSLQPTR